MGFLQRLFGIKQTPKNPMQYVKKLEALLEAANLWGQKNGWPVSEDYPQYKKICEIGEAIDELGGLPAMQEVAYEIRRRNSQLVTLLNMLWSGVGDWMM